LRKCPYCDFFSLPAEPALLADYPPLLIAQLEGERSRDRWQGPFSSVFFGGGTPSLLEPRAIGRILDQADRLFGLQPGAEVTLEANPGTVNAAGLKGYRSAGINRLSLGVQSLDDAFLRRLGRIHTAAEARLAIQWARQAGFDNLGCDLIFALPGQTREAVAEDVRRLLEFGPQHLSCYGLGIEPDTPFARQLASNELQPATEEVFSDSFNLIHAHLLEAGFDHYEISNYARPGRECRHNLNTWRRRAYLGLGPGAHSFCDRGWGERWHVPPDFAAFAAAVGENRDPAVLLETFDRRGAMAETVYLGLRTAEGVEEEGFVRQFGASLRTAFPKAVARCGGHLGASGGRWRLDLAGWLIFDHLIEEFL
jgi:oxygen-independent coproporphyrinogen-3 oxidase